MCFLCAYRISKSRTPVKKIHPVLTPESPSDFGIASFCNIKEYHCATFMCFLCAFQLPKSRTAVLKFYPGYTPDLASPSFAISKNVIAL